MRKKDYIVEFHKTGKDKRGETGHAILKFGNGEPYMDSEKYKNPTSSRKRAMEFAIRLAGIFKVFENGNLVAKTDFRVKG